MNETERQKLFEELLEDTKEMRATHPSFSLMANDKQEDGNDVLPADSLIPFAERIVTYKDETTHEEPTTLLKMLSKVWSNEKYKAMVIKGDGGIGKTVTLLSFATDKSIREHSVGVVYVPLNALSRYISVDQQGKRTPPVSKENPDSISAYLLEEKTEEIYKGITELSKSRWDNGPNLILLLDGFNEVPFEIERFVRDDINAWMRRKGVRIVIASREREIFLDNQEMTIEIILNPLDKGQIAKYLGEEAPPDNDPIWNVLISPLMLSLYLKSNLDKYKNASWLDWHHPVNNAADIFWNYLQRELYELRAKRNNDNDLPVYAAVLFGIAPYIFYKMEQLHAFELVNPVDGNEEKAGRITPKFDEILQEAISYYQNASEQLPMVNQLLSHLYVSYNCSKLTKERALRILIDESGLIKHKRIERLINNEKKRFDVYYPLHQNFRDSMAAMFLKNIIANGVKESKVPVELKASVSEYVKNYLADLENKDEMLKLWELIRKENIAVHKSLSYLPENEITLTHNFLRIYGKMTENDFSKLTFAEMDLRGINLFSYRKENSTLLKLASHDSSVFENTKLSLDCFKSQGHTGSVTSVAFSPEGRRIVSGSRDGTIIIWDAEAHQPIGLPIEGHIEAVNSVSFSPDGKRIISGSADNTIRIWDAEAYEPVGLPLEGHKDSVTSVSYSPDGKRIISGSADNTIRIWDAETHELIGLPLEGHVLFVASVSFSPDSKRIVSGSVDNTIRIWDAEACEPVGLPLEGHKDSVTSVSYSPDGKRIISGSADNTIRIWDAETHQQIGLSMEGHKASVNSIAFSPDGKRIISGSDDGTVRIWDAETHEPIGSSLEGNTREVNAVAFSLDGKKIVSGSDDGLIRIWNAETHRQIGSLFEGHTHDGATVAFSPDGKRIVSGSDDGLIRIWDAEIYQPIGLPLEGHKDSVSSVSFSPDCKRIISGSADNTIRIWDAETHKLIGSPLEGHKASVNSVAFSPDGKNIMSRSSDNTIRIWDAQTHKKIGAFLKRNTDSVTSVSFSPDGNRIVSGSDDGLISIWNTGTHQQIGPPLEGHFSSVISIAFSPDGRRIVSGSDDRTIVIWDAETHQQISPPMYQPLSYPAVSVSFSTDGQRIVCGSVDNTIRIWDVETHKQIGSPLEGHNSPVTSVAFNPDNQRLVSGSEDGTIRIWNAESHECIKVIQPLYGINISGLDFSKAILSSQDKEILNQNGVHVSELIKQ